jgi:hypothetical protein
MLGFDLRGVDLDVDLGLNLSRVVWRRLRLGFRAALK